MVRVLPFAVELALPASCLVDRGRAGGTRPAADDPDAPPRAGT